ncbi:MAG: DNA polymerase, partial [Mycobacterium leprae]
MAENKKLVLLDGNSLANRAFYALRLFSTSDGVYTNAVYGFLTMLYKLLDEEKPDYVAVAFDKGRVTFRTAEYAEYKGTRKAPPDEFRPQLDLLREVLTALNVPWFRVENFEADDLLGTLAKQAAAEGVQTLVVTGDRDALQLIDDRITVVMTKKGITDVVKYDPATLKAEYGLEPRQIIDLKALMGDASDNIPGVPGVGEKTALKLLADYGSLDGVYEHLDEIKGALKEKLANGRELAYKSRWLATISLQAPVQFEERDLARHDPNYADAVALFKRLEFKSLLPKVTPPAEKAEAVAQVAEVTQTAAQPTVNAVEIADGDDLLARAAAAAAAGQLAVLTPCAVPAYDPGRPQPVGMAVAAGETVFWISPETMLRANESLADAEERFRRVVGTLLERCQGLVGHDLKPLYNWAYGHGFRPQAPAFDLALAAYLLDPARTSYPLDDLMRPYGLGELPALSGPDGWATRAAVLRPLAEAMTKALTEQDLLKLFQEVELPLMPVLAEMEATGIAVSQKTLAEMGVELEQRIQALTAQIYEQAGLSFNIGSPKQLGEVLFGKLGLPSGKKTKTGGYSTDAAVLEELAEQHEVVALILDYRTLTKIKSTYVDALGSLIARDGRIHTTFAQTVAETGRLS